MADARAPIAAVAFGARAAGILATARTADGEPVRRRPVPGGSGGRDFCSTPNAPRARGRSPVRSRCCSCRTRCWGRSPARCWTAGTGVWCSSAPTSVGWCWCSASPALLAVGANDLAILFGALIVNGFTRFVSSGLSAALPDVVPRDHVVTMNSVATATGAGGGVPRRQLHAAAALVVRCRRHRRRRNHFDRRGTGVAGAAAVGALPAAHSGSTREQTGDPRLGGLRGGHRMAARRPHGGRRADRGGHPARRWPRTAWCSASTLCWCW